MTSLDHFATLRDKCATLQFHQCHVSSHFLSHFVTYSSPSCHSSSHFHHIFVRFRHMLSTLVTCHHMSSYFRHICYKLSTVFRCSTTVMRKGVSWEVCLRHAYQSEQNPQRFLGRRSAITVSCMSYLVVHMRSNTKMSIESEHPKNCSIAVLPGAQGRLLVQSLDVILCVPKGPKHTTEYSKNSLDEKPSLGCLEIKRTFRDREKNINNIAGLSGKRVGSNRFVCCLSLGKKGSS